MFNNKLKKVLGLVLATVMVVGSLAACGKNTTDPTGTPSNTDAPNPTDKPAEEAKPFYQTLDKNVSGSIDVMVWSGDSIYYEDLGHKDLKPEEITTINVASVYALAKEFNKLYPNVKINLFAQTDDPNSEGTTWRQKMENFRAEHGKFPDVYAANDLPGDLSDGMVADLSVYANDPLYKSFNTGIMATMNYYGFQAGLPQFMQPWGVYVNKELAETNNIDVPEPNWTIDEYTEFVLKADNKNFWGSIGTPMNFFNTGSSTLNPQMSAYSGTGDRINIASDEVMALLSYVPQWAETEIWNRYGQGAIDEGIMGDGWWWSYRFFCRNYLLTCEGDPWMMGSATAPQNADGTWPSNAVESADWDIYPRPSTDYKENNVGIVIDPMAIHNFAVDDGNPEWSDAEKAQRDLAYAFGSFWVGSTEAFKARAEQMYANGELLVTALNDSFPLVTGAEFDKQMEIWYSVDSHKRFGDKELMPGFQEVARLWKEGKIWDISDKTYPYYVMVDGEQTACTYEWNNITSDAVVGVGVTDAAWLDTVKANLAEWNKKINDRFKEAEANIVKGLKTYYGKDVK